MTTNTVNPIPDGYHSLTPYLAVPDGPKAIEFYQSVFGAEVISRQDMPDGRVGQAELKPQSRQDRHRADRGYARRIVCGRGVRAK